MSLRQAPLPDSIVDEAIDWLIRLEMSDHSEDAHPEFERWLQQTPQHQLAWARITGIRRHFSSIPSKPLTQTLSTINQQKTQSGASRRQVLKILSMSGLMLGSGWLSKEYMPWQRLLADYSTRIGEQNSFMLTDNSNVILNTDSAISVDFATDTRQIHLRRGEMQLTTGSDDAYRPRRSMLIKTPFGQISALNTRLTIRLEHDRARLSVHEGLADLINSKGPERLIRSGESLWFSAGRVLPAINSSISPDAWVSGAITGQHIPLGELLDELGRYRVGIIDCAPELKDQQVSGSFQLRDTDKTLRFLAQVQPVRVEFRTAYWVVVRPV